MKLAASLSIATLIIGTAIYFVVPNQSPEEKVTARFGNTSPATDVGVRQGPKGPTIGGPKEQLPLNTHDVEDSSAKSKQLIHDTITAVIPWVSGDQRTVCAELSVAVAPLSESEIARFVTITPEASTLETFVKDGAVCVSGSELQVRHSIVIRKGTPLVTGRKLGTPLQFVASAPDLPAHVAFNEGGHVLARGSAQGIELSVTNLRDIHIEVMRVPERAAVDVTADVYSGTRLKREYEVERLLEDLGTLVWSGSIEGTTRLNVTESVVLPAGDILDQQPNGLFLVFASKPGDTSAVLPTTVFDADQDIGWSDRAITQWVFQTNIGTSAAMHGDGLLVSTRALDTAEPVSGAEVALVTKNNDVIFEGKTNADGFISLPRAAIGGQRAHSPSHLVVRKGGDVTYLSLDGASLDLSDHKIEGRTPVEGVDTYLFSDRGVYRPGETIHLSGVLRDTYGRPVSAPAATLKLVRPDGVMVTSQPIVRDELDGFSTTVAIPSSAPRGRWSFEVMDSETGNQSFGSYSFEVQDFVPERLAVALAPVGLRQSVHQPLNLEGNAKFLYGAPASQLKAEARLTLSTPSKADLSAIGLAGYRFGDQMAPLEARTEQVFNSVTDDVGGMSASITVSAPSFPTTGALGTASQPVRSVITVDVVEPGGRPTTESQSTVLLPDTFVGLNVPSELKIDQAFEVRAIHLSDGLKPVEDANLEWEVRELIWNWYYDRSSDRWESRYRLASSAVASGKLESSSLRDDRFTFTVPALDWGRYALSVSSPASGSYVRQLVDVGWDGKQTGSRPDFMALATKKSSFEPGAAISLYVDSPFDGQATISVWTTDLKAKRVVALNKGKNTFRLPTEADWFPGAYITVQAFRPLRSLSGAETLSADKYVPARLFGSIYLRSEHNRSLAVGIKHPEITQSRQKVPFEIKVEGLNNRKAYAVVQAVDLGILQLTDFETPDPMAYFESKVALSTAFYDDYNRLIRADGQVKALRSGAGAATADIGGSGLNSVPTKSVVLYAGPVALGPDGTTSVDLDIPDFNGTLRTMAIVWSEDAYGSTAEDLVLRDPVVAEAVLPRYLAPGDKSEVTLIIANTEDKPTNANVTLQAGSELTLSEQEISIKLAPNERRSVTIPLKAIASGDTSIALAVKSDLGFEAERSWNLTIRYAGDGPSLMTDSQTLPANGSVDLRPSLAALGEQTIESGFIFIEQASAPPLARAVRELLTYPWTCSEQTTSKAWPILQALSADPGFVTQVAKPVLKNQSPEDWVQENLDRIMSRQSSDGAVGLWRKGDGLVDPLLSARITGFLVDGYLGGYNVPKDAVSRAANWSQTLILDSRMNKTEQMYAMSVLARNVSPMDKSNLRLTRSYADYVTGATAATKLNFAVALRELGDSKRSAELLAESDMTPATLTSSKIYFWSQIMDRLEQAEALFALGESQRGERLLKALIPDLEKDPYLSITEASAITKTMVARSKSDAAISIEIDGVRYESKLGGLLVQQDRSMLASDAPIELVSRTTQPLRVSMAIETLPNPGDALPSLDNGLVVSQFIYSETGQPIPAPLSEVSVNQRLVVLAQVTAAKDLGYSQILFQHPIPAGFQVEKIITPELRDNAYGWLPELTAVDVIEGRDDRVVAAQLDDFDKGDLVLKVAFILRATTPGQYLAVQPHASNMYEGTLFGTAESMPIAVTAQ